MTLFYYFDILIGEQNSVIFINLVIVIVIFIVIVIVIVLYIHVIITLTFGDTFFYDFLFLNTPVRYHICVSL